MNQEPNYNEIDPGVQKLVRLLRAAGYETIDSGDGITKFEAIKEGGALEWPHVFMRVAPSSLATEATNLMNFMDAIGIDIWPQGAVDEGGVMRSHIEASYDPKQGDGIIALHCVDDSMLPGVQA